MAYKDPEAQRTYQREWIARRRRDFFADKQCVNCGSVEELELDHVDRKTKISHSIWSWSESRRLNEIAKCQVLCHDCHWTKTKTDLGYKEAVHGTNQRYKYYGCRCIACKAAHAAKQREYKARTRA